MVPFLGINHQMSPWLRRAYRRRSSRARREESLGAVVCRAWADHHRPIDAGVRGGGGGGNSTEWRRAAGGRVWNDAARSFSWWRTTARRTRAAQRRKRPRGIFPGVARGCQSTTRRRQRTDAANAEAGGKILRISDDFFRSQYNFSSLARLQYKVSTPLLTSESKIGDPCGTRVIRQPEWE